MTNGCTCALWQRVGDYDETRQAFSIRTIPAPPEARAVMHDDAEWPATRYGLEMRLACPSCHHAVLLEWSKDVSHEAMRMSVPEVAALALGGDMARDLIVARRDVLRIRDIADHNAALALIEQERCERMRAALSRKRRKAKQTEAQRRKDGDRRRRNAR